MSSEQLKKLSTESTDEYIIRICEQKPELGLTWDEVACILNSELDENLSERTYRRRYENWLMKSSDAEEVDDFLALKKERIRLQDERSQINNLVRLQAREEMMMETAIQAAREVASIKPLTITRNKEVDKVQNKIGTLAIGDWHYGLEVDVFYNKFNQVICRNRVKELAIEALDIIEKENLEIINIINLGDMISGRIHLPLRVNSRCDVVTQTMEVSELLAEFLNVLSQFVKINYYSVSDNHSRIEPNKKESLQTEAFTRIIDWYLAERLKDNENIRIFNNLISDDICTFKIFGRTVAAVHGDKDKTNKVISNLNLFLQNHVDMIFTAHLHHFSADESNETVRFCNGSLIGTDDFASDLRLNSKPSQLFVISTEDNLTECVYKINLS